MTTNISHISHKMFVCNACSTTCVRPSEWVRHIGTTKHKNNEKREKDNVLTTIVTHICKCGNKYADRAGLWRHKKKCSHLKIQETPIENTMIYNDLIADKDQIINYLMKENSEFKSMMIEQNKTIMDLAVKAGNTTNNSNNTNCNNKFNLNVFLNETCKDAINLTDFVRDINISLSELENVGNNGYFNGISDIIVNRLRDLEYNRSPLHCTDLKRETMYIREDNAWKKDTKDNPNVKWMVDRVASKNCGKISEWREVNPDCKQLDHQLYETCLTIMIQSAGQLGEKQIRMDEKIMKNIANEVFVDKNI